MCLGIPGEILDAPRERPELATVLVSGVRRVVNVGLLDDVGPGDWVLIHVGFAMSKIDEEEARMTLQMLEGMGQAYRDELSALSSSEIG
jgi:hydrogenase expression/formation protein HypC